METLIDIMSWYDETEIHVTALSTKTWYTGTDNVQPTLIQIVALIKKREILKINNKTLINVTNIHSDVVVNHLSKS